MENTDSSGSNKGKYVLSVILSLFLIALIIVIVVIVTKSSSKCNSDKNCKRGEKCLNKVCRNNNWCSTNAHCATGQVCRENKCINNAPTPTPECKNDNDCGDGVCIDGSCQQPTDGCRNNDDCDEGICIDGVCNVDECHNNEDCNVNEICVDKKCESPRSIEVPFGTPPYRLVEFNNEINNRYTCEFDGKLSKLSIWLSGCLNSSRNRCTTGANQPGIGRMFINVSRIHNGVQTIDRKHEDVGQQIYNRHFNYNIPVVKGDVIIVNCTLMSTDRRLYHGEVGSNNMPRMTLTFMT